MFCNTIVRDIKLHTCRGTGDESTPTEVRTPQQLNGYDCGVYMVLIAHYLANHLALDSGSSDLLAMTDELSQWLIPQRCTAFRQEMIEMIESMFKEKS